MKDSVVIVDAVRTAIGTFGGSLSNTPAHMLGAQLIKALLKRNGLDNNAIDEVIISQVLTAGVGQNAARQAALFAGLEHTTTAVTINQVCGGGLRSVSMAMQTILCQDADIIIAGGQENMSMSAHVLPHSRTGKKMGDWQAKDTMIVDGLFDAFNEYHMGITAENIAEQYAISRKAQDDFALKSQQKALRAIKNNVFVNEIIPIELTNNKSTSTFATDEHPRKIDAEKLSTLRPAFKQDGTVTAGNSSGINDGAALVLLMRESVAKRLKITPMARIISYASTGVDPAYMGIAPISASKLCLKKANWSADELDLIEVNEAFSAQAICVNKQMQWNEDKVNVNGGAIALGHPIGASGCRVLVSLVHHMHQTNKQKGLATLCIGGGQGIAMAVEKYE